MAFPEASSRQTFEVPWKLCDIAFGLALVILLATAAIVSLLGLRTLIGPQFLEARRLAVLTGASLVLEGSMLVSAWYYGIRKYHVSWQVLGFRSFNWVTAAGLIWVVVFGGLLINVAYVAVLDALSLQHLRPPSALPQFGRSPVAVMVAFVLAGILAPVAEETFFRGFVLPGIAKHAGGFWGLIVSSVLFGAAHLQIAALVPIVLLGILLGLVYMRTASVWPCIMIHGVYNSLALLAGLSRPSG